MTSIPEPEQDQIGNQLRVPNQLYQPLLPKEDLFKDLLQKKETTKIISIQNQEQVELVSKELNHFGVIADLFRQIGGHSSRFVLFCSF